MIQARLAERLGISAPSVSEMVRRLSRDGWVDLLPDRRIRLTADGQEYAEKVERRHRLAECLLIDILGLPWSLAHEEAEKFEQVISDAVEERIIAILNRPARCPHGNPIPGLHDGPAEEFEPLGSVEPGSTVVLRRVTEDIEIHYPTMRYLDEHGFIPGSKAVVVGAAPDGSLTLEVDGSPMAIGSDLARHLFVDVIEPA